MSADFLAVIPARGGSKRIPHKNIKDFNGLPLIAYSIKAAQDSGIFKDIVVSTDDEEIAQVAREYGAQVPFMRDEVLSNDFTGTQAVCNDAYLKMKKLGKQYNGVVTIYATAPLLTGKYLKQAYDKFMEQKADSIFACCEFPFPIQRGYYLKEDGTPYAVMPECMPMRSQDLEPAYQDAGQFYFNSIRFIEYLCMTPEQQKAYLPTLEKEPFVYRAFQMPRYRVIDIDTPEDWEYALILANAVNQLKRD